MALHARALRAAGPQPDGPVNQNNELKAAEGCRPAVLLFSAVLAVWEHFHLNGEPFDSKLISAKLLNGD